MDAFATVEGGGKFQVGEAHRLLDVGHALIFLDRPAPGQAGFQEVVASARPRLPGRMTTAIVELSQEARHANQ